jgi:competence ComEA-like helix-hairpin-helix protein
MPEITNREANQARGLILFTLLLGFFANLFGNDQIYPHQAVPAGEAIIAVDDLSKPSEIEIIQTGKASPERVIINNSNLEELVCCPGIGTKTAQLILLERSYGKFADWRDLKDRVRGIGANTVEKLKESGVRLSAD